MSEHEAATSTEQQPPPPAGRGRVAWRRLLLGAIILLCGVAIGAGGATIIAPKRLFRGLVQGGQAPGALTKGMTGALKLSPEQAKQVESIIAQRARAMEEIRNESRPRVHEQLELMKQEVAAVLTDEQAQAWRERCERLERLQPRSGRRRGREGGRGERGRGRRAVEPEGAAPGG